MDLSVRVRNMYVVKCICATSTGMLSSISLYMTVDIIEERLYNSLGSMVKVMHRQNLNGLVLGSPT